MLLFDVVEVALYLIYLLDKEQILQISLEVALYPIYLLDKEQISLTLFAADQILRLTNGKFNSLNLSTERPGGETIPLKATK